jgi:hypothetical protein
MLYVRTASCTCVPFLTPATAAPGMEPAAQKQEQQEQHLHLCIACVLIACVNSRSITAVYAPPHIALTVIQTAQPQEAERPGLCCAGSSLWWQHVRNRKQARRQPHQLAAVAG